MANNSLLSSDDRGEPAGRRYVPGVKLVWLTLFCAFFAGACSGHTAAAPVASTTAPVPASTTTTAAADDAQTRQQISITSCRANAAGHVEIKGSAHNPTSRPVSYSLQLTIRDPSDNRFYATAAGANDVAPSHTAKWDVATTAPYHAGVTCALARATRRAP